ncbi:MAG: radical SAM/SPASM domain-containing protein [Desulfocucumaceae bacterium]
MLSYKTQSLLGHPQTKPLTLTVSITQNCNSKCLTCNIWKDGRTGGDRQSELSLEEYERVFRSLGKSVIWYTLSGGEPFLRKDITEIAALIKRYSNPKVINIPTNAILGNRIVQETEKIIKILAPDTSLIVNLSLDGIGEKHDAIRGIKGNYERFISTFNALKELKKFYPSFELGVHSVVSRYNVENLMELYAFVKENLRPDSFICEIAENREELLNTQDNITPPVDLYENFIRPLQRELKSSLLHNPGITGIIQAFRLKYYDYVIEELREKKRIIPCYAGFVSAQISPWGDVWPCCILAYKAHMGNLREYGLDFEKLWYSQKAIRVRREIYTGSCYCPMANAHYTNMALSPKAMTGVCRNFLGSRLAAKNI